MLTDLYQLTMVGGYVQEGKRDQWANFDYFFRKIPDDGGYCILAGLADIIDYIRTLHFTQEDLSYLDGLGIFSKEFLTTCCVFNPCTITHYPVNRIL